MKKNTAFFREIVMGLLLTAWVGSGCVESQQTVRKEEPTQPPPLAAADLYTHTVKYFGESLSIIAKWYTGDLKNWEKLAPVNPSLNPNRIYVGDKIRIPKSMMITQEVMPEEHVKQFLPPAEEKPPAAQGTPAPEAKDKTPVLFGPKGMQQ